MLLGLGVVFVMLLLAPAALAQGAPGSLAQLSSPNNCVQQTTDSLECGSNGEGLSGTEDVVASPDGKNVYVVSTGDNAIAEFTRGSGGSLSQIGCIAPTTPVERAPVSTCSNDVATGLYSPEALVVSPDGKDVYVAAQDSNGVGTIAELTRNGDGTLSQQAPPLDCVAENLTQTDVTSDCANQTGHGIESPVDLAISSDGQNVYAGDQGGGAVATFIRNADGSLSQPNGAGDCIADQTRESNDCTASGTGLGSVRSVVMSPDGGNVYSAGADNQGSGVIAEFTRHADGSLTQIDCVEQQADDQGCGATAKGLAGIIGLAASPDGHNVYSASEQPAGPLAEFTRNANGSLTQLAPPNDCIESGTDYGCGTQNAAGIGRGSQLKVSPDGASAYATAPDCNGCADVAEFSRDGAGALHQLPSPDNCIQQHDMRVPECGSSNAHGLDTFGKMGLVISPDSANVYVAGPSDVAEFARAPVTLTVTRSGSGNGTVSDNTGTISCPSSCQHAYYDEHTQVTLTATPASGSTFAGWSGGGCSGTGTCTVTMDADTNVTATFVQLNTLTVSRSGSGSGSVSDGTGTISCPADCSHAYSPGSRVTLTASPGSGSVFSGWSGGGCSGTGTCTVTMNADTSVTARFSPLPAAGPGSPSIRSDKPVVHGGNSAGFSGTVNPEDSQTHVFWQYGLDRRYTKPGATGPHYTAATNRQSVGSDGTTHPVSTTVRGLFPNALYHFRMVAYNIHGTAFGPDQTFITGESARPGAAVLGKSFGIAPLSGRVYIVIGHRLILLTRNTQIPAGSIIDALHGSLSLTSASGQKGKHYHGIFGGAVFRLTQGTLGADRGLTTLTLVEGTFKGARTYATCKAKGATTGPRAAAHIALSSRVLQTLRSRSSGRFRTRGRYAAGTVRGTRWTTSDRCDGTLFAVQLHSVVVYDFVKQFFLLLPQGHSYLAGPHTPPPPESEELTEPHNEGGETSGP